MTLTTFTPLASLAGGALIGLSAVLLMATHGRIAGISGITSQLFPPYTDGNFLGRLAFIAGLVAAPFAVGLVTGSPVSQTVSTDLTLMAGAGLLVGFGSVWGQGCTSGHGVCGTARLSPRSIAATLVFTATAAATVFAVRHLAGG
jgi:uncharacterized membrane protein YedE/YeeE